MGSCVGHSLEECYSKLEILPGKDFPQPLDYVLELLFGEQSTMNVQRIVISLFWCLEICWILCKSNICLVIVILALVSMSCILWSPCCVVSREMGWSLPCFGSSVISGQFFLGGNVCSSTKFRHLFGIDIVSLVEFSMDCWEAQEFHMVLRKHEDSIQRNTIILFSVTFKVYENEHQMHS